MVERQGALEFQSSVGDTSVRVVSRPGLPDWGRVSPAMQLLAEHARVDVGERVLVSPGGHGALGVWAARHTSPGRALVYDTNVVAVECSRATLRANGLPSDLAQVALPYEAPQALDVVLMPLPKGRDLTRLYLLGAYRALASGGRLYLAGANGEGIKSALADAAVLFGDGLLLGYRKGNRVMRFVRPVAMPSSAEAMYGAAGLEEGTYASFDVDIAGASLQIASRPGVFSRHGLDAGTQLLLESLVVRTRDRVLDVGCGYGVIGAAAALRATGGAVTLVDADLLAVRCARETLRRNGLSGPEVLLGDGLAAVAGRRFTLIVSNPPFHAGHEQTQEVAQALVEAAHDAVEIRGRLVIVANRFLPYHRSMEQRFGAVNVLAQTPQYRVMESIKAHRRDARDSEAV